MQELKLDWIKLNPHQTRIVDDNDPETIELAESIREERVAGVSNNGLIQLPDVISIVNSTDVEYYLVSGERRLRAFHHLNRTYKDEGWDKMPVNISRTFNGEKGEELQFYLWRRAGKENNQRLPLKPIEKAKALKMGVEGFGLTLEKAGKPYGVTSRGAVKNYLNLLELPIKVQELINEGKLTMAHGKSLYSLMINDDKFTKNQLTRLAEDWFLKDANSIEAEKQVNEFLADKKEQEKMEVPDWVTPPTQETEKNQDVAHDPFENRIGHNDKAFEKTVQKTKPDVVEVESPTLILPVYTPNPPCPLCGADHIAGTNGGERWCLECGGRWANVDELNNSIEAKSVPQKEHSKAGSELVDDKVEVLVRIKKELHLEMIASGKGYDDIINQALEMYFEENNE